MSNKSYDKNGNLVIDLGVRSEGNIKVSFQRCTADKMEPCMMCKVMTPRTLIHKLDIDNMWNVLFWCDFCYSAVTKMKAEFHGI